MSTIDPETLQRELLLEQAINKQMDALVRQATKTVTVLGNDTRMEENQLRNLLNVAIESRSVEVVINFIRYQIARGGSAWGTRPNDFGHTVIHDLRTRVKEFTDNAIADVREHVKDTAEVDALYSSVYARLMQLYLGYLNRAFYYAKKVKSFSTLVEVTNA